jgi:hypothetical protein
MNPFLTSVVRHLLTLVAGGLIAVGVGERDAANLVQAAEPVVGGLLLYGMSQAWSWFDKRKKR